MIVVVGRPGLDANDQLDRPAALIALAARAAGAPADVVGAIGDDADGDRVTVALGKAGIGHAALLRDPSAPTPRPSTMAGPQPRLDGQDVELGLAYLTEFRGAGGCRTARALGGRAPRGMPRPSKVRHSSS